MHAILYRILWLDSDSWHKAQFDLSAVTKPVSQRERDLSHVPFRQFLRVGGFPGGAVVEGLPANAGDMGSSPGLGGSHMPRSD